MTGMHIGSFSVVRKIAAGKTQEPDYFDFCGERIRVSDEDPSALPFLELADAMENGVDTDDTQGMAAMYRMLRGCVHPDDWAKFRKVSMANNASPEDLMPIVGAVWEAVTGRPSRRPSGSPDGPSATGTDSKDASSSPATAPASPPPSVTAAPVPDRPPTTQVVVDLPPGWPMPPPERQDVYRPQVLVTGPVS